jgi:hypothetical protein
MLENGVNIRVLQEVAKSAGYGAGEKGLRYEAGDITE